MWFKSKRLYLTSGSANGGTPLNAFDNAMRKARIADFNILRVTSIVPPNLPVDILPEGPIIHGRGRMLPAVYSSIESNIPGEIISAGIGIGLPEKNSNYSGVIFTAEGRFNAKALENQLRQMITEGMKEMRLVPEYKFVSAISSTEVPVSGRWTSAFAAAPFVDCDLEEIFHSTVIS